MSINSFNSKGLRELVKIMLLDGVIKYPISNLNELKLSLEGKNRLKIA